MVESFAEAGALRQEVLRDIPSCAVQPAARRNFHARMAKHYGHEGCHITRFAYPAAPHRQRGAPDTAARAKPDIVPRYHKTLAARDIVADIWRKGAKNRAANPWHFGKQDYTFIRIGCARGTYRRGGKHEGRAMAIDESLGGECESRVRGRGQKSCTSQCCQNNDGNQG